MSDGDNKNDLTRIEDLSEFLHQGDDDLDKVLADIEAEDDSDQKSDEAEVELSSFDYSTPENPDEAIEENNFEESFDDNFEASFEDQADDNSNEGFDNNFDDSFESYDNEEDPEGLQEGFQDDDQNEHQDGYEEDQNNAWPEDDLQDQNSQEESSQNDFEDSKDSENFENFEDDHEVSFSNEDDPSDEITDQDILTEEDDTNDIAEIELSNDDNQDIEDTPDQEISMEEVNYEETTPLPDLSTKIQEDLSDVRDFATNSTYGKAAIGGNPPFSILLQGINTEEFEDSILATLNEFGLLEGNEDLYRKSLESGQLLIAQIGEFSAITLAGKLRRYCRNIKVALAHEIHKSDSYDHTDQRGLTGPRSILQNKSKHFVKKEFNEEDVALSTSPYIPGYKIIHSLGPMQINEQIDRSEFDDFSSINLVEYFGENIRKEAYKKGANAVISIHFNIGQKEINGKNYNIIMAHGDFVYLEASE
ncbi:hypothetical protein [Halobacteriovorax sp. YZS-1-1]|uniref:hypothetical protein n=1 Tax=unclassified Halobacteriovorax TaxID=2639665 RepID=UPI003999725C